MFSAGVDIGYRAQKIVCANGQNLTQSVVGSPDMSTFGVSGGEVLTIKVGDRTYLLGQHADEQSRFASRGQETRDWINSADYDVLIKAAIGWLYTQGNDDEMTIVTGLPVAYYDRDKNKLKERFEGVHSGEYCGQPFEVRVVNCRVIPQPFGTLFAEVYDDLGVVIEENTYLLNSKTAILDVGSHTTNMQVVLRGDSLAKDSTSIAVGGWKLVQAMRDHLAELMPELNPTDHQIAEAIAGAANLTYFGEDVDIRAVARPFAEQIAGTITAAISNTWGTAADVKEILVTGGGAYLIGEFVDYRQARIVDDPIFANARGYYRMARRISRK